MGRSAAGLVQVRVSMGGGCAPHVFVAHYRNDAGGATVLWIEHDAHNDTCEALISRTVEVSLPAAARAGTLTVRGPNGQAFPVR